MRGLRHPGFAVRADTEWAMAAPILIQSQPCPGGVSYLAGTVDGLRQLRDAIDRAIEEGRPVSISASGPKRDGFRLIVAGMAPETLASLRVDFLQPNFNQAGKQVAEVISSEVIVHD